MNDNSVSYVPDPTMPYEKLSNDDKAIDYLQFPWHTLEYKSGDCDDMSSNILFLEGNYKK